MPLLKITKSFLSAFIFLFFFCSNNYGQIKTSSTSFRVKHTSNSRYFVSRKYIHTSSNETIIVGKWGATEDGSDLLVMKLNVSGEVVWSKRVVVDIELYEYEVVELSDGSITVIANSFYNSAPTNSNMLLIKFTCKGDIVWSKKLAMKVVTTAPFLSPYSIKEGKNNDVIVSFYGGESTSKYTVVSRINSSGDLVWSKSFYGTQPETNLPAVSFFNDNKIVVFGFKSMYTNSYNYNKSFFAMKLNYDNGSIEETKSFNYSEFLTYYGVLVTHPKIHFYGEILSNGNYVLYGKFSNYDQQNTYYYRLSINKDLSIAGSQAFSSPFDLGMGWSKISVFPNGQTHIVSSVYDYRTFYWYAADSNNNKIREKKIEYPNAYLHLQYMAAQNGTNRSTYMVSSITGDKSSIEVVQAEDNDPGALPCLGADTTFIRVLPWSVTGGNSTQWQAVKDNEVTLEQLQFVALDINVTSEYICEPVKSVEPENNQIKIIGNDTVCSSALSYNYIASTKSKIPVQWELDSEAEGALTRLNDSTVSITFKNSVGIPLHLKLYAYSGSCSVLKDSISITVLPDNNKFSGSYTKCDLPIKLQPGPWFKNYLWQDGSTDSVYVVTKPGKYVVRLQTYCGQFISDSIEVSEQGTGIKHTYAICEKDSVTISATAGFSKYEWSPLYNMVQLSSTTIKVYPQKDTFYTLKVTTLQGCELTDTVYVKVNKARSINLGKDTTICRNEEINLNAGNNFSNYNWNTGSVTQKLVTNKPGTYYVTALDGNGCISSDTITINERECQNSIYIPNAFTPNSDGRNDVFKPIVSGSLAEYELIVYNRLGEMIFKTNQVSTGWSGTYKGIQQNTETFVWVCKYRFQSEKSKMQKGTLVLIR